MEETKEVLKKYKVIGDIHPCDEEGNVLDIHLEIDSIQEVPEELGSSWVNDGLAVEVTE